MVLTLYGGAPFISKNNRSIRYSDTLFLLNKQDSVSLPKNNNYDVQIFI